MAATVLSSGASSTPFSTEVKRFLQPVEALLVGAERAGGIGLDAGQLSPDQGVAGVNLPGPAGRHRWRPGRKPGHPACRRQNRPGQP